MSQVKFIKGTQKQYDALKKHDADAIYFITDSASIYLNDVKFSSANNYSLTFEKIDISQYLINSTTIHFETIGRVIQVLDNDGNVMWPDIKINEDQLPISSTIDLVVNDEINTINNIWTLTKII